jgi:hypothetical protein
MPFLNPLAQDSPKGRELRKESPPAQAHCAATLNFRNQWLCRHVGIRRQYARNSRKAFQPAL